MPYTKESVARAYHVLRREEYGRRAVDEGWPLALWEWIADRNAEPSNEQLAEIKRAALKLREKRASWPEMCRAAHERKERRIMEAVNGRG